MTTHSEAPSMRELLARNPLSFNELLDMFEAYVATVSPPLFKARDLIEEQFDYKRGEIFTQILTVCDTDLIARKLKQVRAAHNADGEVMITLTRKAADEAEAATSEVEYLLTQAACVFEHLHTGVSSGYFAMDERGALSVMHLAHRALDAAAEQEGVILSRLSGAIRAASVVQSKAQGEAA